MFPAKWPNEIMKTKTRHPNMAIREKLTAILPGKVGWALLWLIGVPVPILLIFFLLRGCT